MDGRRRLRRPSGTAGGALWLLPLVITLAGGNIKLLPVLSGVPFDLTVAAAGVVALQVFFCVAVRGFAIPQRPAVWLYVLFLLLFLSLFWTSFDEYSTQKAVRLFSLTLLAAAAPVVLIRSRGDLRRFLDVLAYVGLATCISALVRAGEIVSNDWGRLAVSEDANSLGLARLAGYVVVWSVIRAASSKPRQAAGWLALAAPAAAALVRTISQGAFFGAVIAILVVLTLHSQQRRWVRFPVIAAALGGGVYTAATVPGDFQREGLFSIGVSTTSRLGVWRETFWTTFDRPWGAGVGDFAEVVDVPWEETFAVYPHNLWLETGVEAGLLAAVVLLALSGAAVYRAMRGRGLESRLLAASLIFWLANAAVSGDINGNRTAFALMFVAMSCSIRQSVPAEDVTVVAPEPAGGDAPVRDPASRHAALQR